MSNYLYKGTDLSNICIGIDDISLNYQITTTTNLASKFKKISLTATSNTSINDASLCDTGTSNLIPYNLNGEYDGSPFVIAIDSSNNVYAQGASGSGGTMKKWTPTSDTSGSWSSLNGVFNGFVIALAIDSNNNIYAGGSFTTPYSRIAKWTTSGSSWSALGTTINNSVNALAIDSNNNVYVGGSFTSPYSRIAKWTPTSDTSGSWSALGAGMTSNTVNAIAIDSNNNVYVGGSFTTPYSYIAKWTPSTSSWSALGTTINNNVEALAIDSNNNVYVGGDFSSPYSRIAKWTPTSDTSGSWSDLSGGISSNPSTNEVRTLEVDLKNNVYVGGKFTTAGGKTVNNIAKWTPSTGTSGTWSDISGGVTGTTTSTYVYSIAIDSNNNLYVGGVFTTAFSTTVTNLVSIKINTDVTKVNTYLNNNTAFMYFKTYNSLATSTGLNSPVYALTIDSSNNIYVGGNITSVDGTTINRIAKCAISSSAYTWSNKGDSTVSGNSIINDLAVDSYGNIFAAGNINLLKLYATGGNWSVQSSSTYINALKIDSNNNVYVGGTFTNISTLTSANYIAKIKSSSDSWSKLNTGLDNPVQTLAIDQSDNIYAGGDFTTAGGTTVNYVAKWTPTSDTSGSWSTLKAPTGTLVGTDGKVTALKFDTTSNTLYVCGAFKRAGDISANEIAIWTPSTSTWSVLSSSLSDISGSIYALELDSIGNVYIGGNFTSVNGDKSIKYLAKYSETKNTWSTIGHGVNGTVRKLLTDSYNNLYAGGDFTRAGGDEIKYLVKII